MLRWCNGLFLIFLSSVTFADPRRPYTFDDCISIAKQNNSEIQAAEGALRAKYFQLKVSEANYYPQLSASLSYLNVGPADSFKASYSDRYSVSLNLSQNLFNGFLDTYKTDEARGQLQSSEESLRITKAKTSYELKVAFGNFLYAKDLEKVTQDFLLRRQENLRMVELRFASGRENKGSVLLSQAYFIQAKGDVLKARHLRETNMNDLKKNLGIQDADALDIQDNLPLSEPSNMEPEYDLLVRESPLWKQSSAEVERARASVGLAKAGFLPSLNLTGSMGKSSNDFFPQKDSWTVGATLSWSFFNGGRDYYSEKSAAANLGATNLTLNQLKRQIAVNLRKSFVAFIEAIEELKISEAFLAAAKSRSEIARAKYNNGLMSFDEWDLIENDLINKSKIFLQTKRDRISAEAAWEQAQGIGDIP